jgi:hypothetical protein
MLCCGLSKERWDGRRDEVVGDGAVGLSPDSHAMRGCS